MGPSSSAQKQDSTSRTGKPGIWLNVIEDPSERAQTLRKAAELTKQALIVAVRADSSLEDAEQFGDGKITVAGTFQKIYDQTEFRDYLTSLLNKRPYLVAPGIAYLFFDSARESHYLATQIFTRRLEYRTDLIGHSLKIALLANT